MSLCQQSVIKPLFITEGVDLYCPLFTSTHPLTHTHQIYYYPPPSVHLATHPPPRNACIRFVENSDLTDESGSSSIFQPVTDESMDPKKEEEPGTISRRRKVLQYLPSLVIEC